MTKHKNTFANKLNGFVAIPLLVANLPVSFMGQLPVTTPVTEAFKNGIFFESKQEIAIDLELQKEAAKIDAYFGKWDLPLEGYGEVFVKTARKYDLDPFLLPAIAMRETTGGKFMCAENNMFGYGSCTIDFDSFEHAIDTVGQALAGVHPTIGYAYEGKDTRGILETYNPPSVVATYADEVMGIMKKIANVDATHLLAMK